MKVTSLSNRQPYHRRFPGNGNVFRTGLATPPTRILKSHGAAKHERAYFASLAGEKMKARSYFDEAKGTPALESGATVYGLGEQVHARTSSKRSLSAQWRRSTIRWGFT